MVLASSLLSHMTAQAAQDFFKKNSSVQVVKVEEPPAGCI
jgi:hypothetical protein